MYFCPTTSAFEIDTIPEVVPGFRSFEREFSRLGKPSRGACALNMVPQENWLPNFYDLLELRIAIEIEGMFQSLARAIEFAENFVDEFAEYLDQKSHGYVGDYLDTSSENVLAYGIKQFGESIIVPGQLRFLACVVSNHWKRILAFLDSALIASNKQEVMISSHDVFQI